MWHVRCWVSHQEELPNPVQERGAESLLETCCDQNVVAVLTMAVRVEKMESYGKSWEL